MTSLVSASTASPQAFFIYNSRKALWHTHCNIDHPAFVPDLVSLIGEYLGFLPTQQEVERLCNRFSVKLLSTFNLSHNSFFDLPIVHFPQIRPLPSEAQKWYKHRSLLPSEMVDVNGGRHALMRGSENGHPFLAVGIRPKKENDDGDHLSTVMVFGKIWDDGSHQVETTRESLWEDAMNEKFTVLYPQLDNTQSPEWTYRNYQERYDWTFEIAPTLPRIKPFANCEVEVLVERPPHTFPPHC